MVKKKKTSFTKCEIEIVGEAEKRLSVLFGGLSSEIRKRNKNSSMGKKETEGFNLKAKKPRNGQNKRQKKSIISHKDNIIAAGDTDVHTAEEKQHKEA